jgi:hypothetical protein
MAFHTCAVLDGRWWSRLYLSAWGCDRKMVGDPRDIAPRMAEVAKKFESAYKFQTLFDIGNC